MTAIRIDASVIERCAFVPGGAGGWSCGAAAVASAIAPVTNGGRPPRAQETPETRVAPLAKRTCGCGALVNAPEWLGFVLLASVAAGAALRRRG